MKPTPIRWTCGVIPWHEHETQEEAQACIDGHGSIWFAVHVKGSPTPIALFAWGSQAHDMLREYRNHKADIREVFMPKGQFDASN